MKSNKSFKKKKDSRQEKAEGYISAIMELKKKNKVGLKIAIRQFLAGKGVTAKSDVDFYLNIIPSLAGKRGAWKNTKERVEQARKDADHEDLKEALKKGREEREKRELEKNRQFNLFR